jgi:parallel beta-helix repeat protein
MAESSGARGIQTGIGCTVADCQTSNSVGVGIFTSDRSVVRHSVGNFNGEVGIQVGQGCVVVGCTAVSNGTNAAATSRDGIKCSTAGTIVDCTAQNNQANGIAASQGSTVSRCTASGNFSDGIEVTTDCRVLENTCDGNGSGANDGAGIHATQNSNRIDSNHVTDNDRGIDVDAIGNLIVRNSASGNTTNYDIVANNRYGVVVDLTAAGPPLVNGNSAAGTLTTTDPWANTAY